MKKQWFYSSVQILMIALMLLSGCSKEENLDDPGKNKEEEKEETKGGTSFNVKETYEVLSHGKWETKTKEYTLILKQTEEGQSVETTEDGTKYIGGSWSYTNGKINITGHIIATQTQNTWDRFDGTVDDMKNPQKITRLQVSRKL